MELEGGERRSSSGKDDGFRAKYVEDAKKQAGLAGPLIAVSILQYSLQIISVMFNGHLGELPLAGASMGTSFASVTGFTVLVSDFSFFFSFFFFFFFFFFVVNYSIVGKERFQLSIFSFKTRLLASLSKFLVLYYFCGEQ